MKSKDMLGLGQCHETPGTNLGWWVTELDTLPKKKLLRDTYIHGEGSAITSCSPCSMVGRNLVPLTSGYTALSVDEHKHPSLLVTKTNFVQVICVGRPSLAFTLAYTGA